ncbi:MAG: hypothetical protein ACREUC_09940, partial [Steroidobacteraceae bacterium]
SAPNAGAHTAAIALNAAAPPTIRRINTLPFSADSPNARLYPTRPPRPVNHRYFRLSNVNGTLNRPP